MTKPPLETEYDHPPARPPWISDDLLVETMRVWQPYYDQPLGEDDVVGILIYVGELFDLANGLPPRAKSD